MRSRWLIVSALIVAVGLAVTGAATTDASKATAVVSTNAAAAEPQAQPVAGKDPYLGTSPITTTAPTGRVRCQVYASDCVFDGGPCGPGGVCHCLFTTDGWICGR